MSRPPGPMVSLLALQKGGIGQVSRRLLRAPLFAVVAVLTLGVGIGANAALVAQPDLSH